MLGSTAFIRELTFFSGAKIIDATDKFIVPGGIDSSTNLRAGEDLADDMNSGTRYRMVSQKKSRNLIFFKKKKSILVHTYLELNC